MSDEQRYTLDEARKILARQTCEREGHTIIVDQIRAGIPTRVIRSIVACEQCGALFEEAK